MNRREVLLDEMWIQRALRSLREGGVEFTIVAEFQKGSDDEWRYNRGLRFRQQ